jgi:hypothetical protein
VSKFEYLYWFFILLFSFIRSNSYYKKNKSRNIRDPTDQNSSGAVPQYKHHTGYSFKTHSFNWSVAQSLVDQSFSIIEGLMKLFHILCRVIKQPWYSISPKLLLGAIIDSYHFISHHFICHLSVYIYKLCGHLWMLMSKIYG